MSNVGNQAIKCNVASCKYHDTSNYCKLTDIVVGAEKSDCKTVKETECTSFECGSGCH